MMNLTLAYAYYQVTREYPLASIEAGLEALAALRASGAVVASAEMEATIRAAGGTIPPMEDDEEEAEAEEEEN